MIIRRKLFTLFFIFLINLIKITLKIFVPKDIDNPKHRKFKSLLIRLSNKIQKNIFDEAKFSLTVKFIPEKNYSISK